MKHFLFLILGIFSLQTIHAQNQALDSLFRIYSTYEKEDASKIDLLNEIAWEFNVVNIDSTAHYSNKALELAEQKKYFAGKARALNLTAIYFSYKNKIDSSILLNKRALALSLKYDFKKYRDGIYNDLAIDYGLKGDYVTSLEYYYKALEVLFPDDEFRIYTILNIAATHWQLGNKKQAEYYYDLSTKIANESTNKQIIHHAIVEKSFHFSRKEQIDSALFYLNKAYHIAIAENMEVSARNDKVAIANLYLDMEAYDSCIAVLQSLNILDAGEVERSLRVQYCGMMSYAYKGKKEFDKALEYRLKCKVAAEIAGRVDLMPHIHKQLSDIYVAKNDFQNAYQSYISYHALEDSINSVEKERAFLELDAQYQVSRKEELNQELKKTNVLLTIAAIFFVLFTLVSTLLLIMRNKSAKVLKSKNQELQILNTQLTIAKKEALEASETKQDFLSRMSHEIRTPLNAVIGFVNILIKEKPRLDQLPYLHHLKSSGKYLMHLINNLLDFSRLEAGKLEIQDEAFDLKQLLKEMVDSFRLANIKEEVKIELDLKTDQLNRKVIGSAFRLNQVLYNLMSNALKFTSKGHVILRVTMPNISKSKDTIEVQFEVEDTGIGIPADRQKKIFESFIQADSSVPQNFGGSGLGLSIVKDLLALFGSEVKLQSEEGKGANFLFILQFPLGEILENDVSVTKSPYGSAAIKSLKNLKILLAEDNLFNQKIATKILENQGVIVTSVNNGLEAIQLLEKERFDLILMDLHMPIMDGEEAINKIRRLDNDKKNIPIILLSATTLDPFISNVKSMAVEYYIEKPFSPEVLYEAISNCLNINQLATT